MWQFTLNLTLNILDFENNCPIFCTFAPNILAGWLIHDATHGDGYHAGIGSIGGSIFAGNINIHGGDIEATGGKYGAGIGGGDNTGFDNDKTRGGLTVYDGTVTATGGEYGAGIGCSLSGTTTDICIYAGTVNATGGKNGGAGIGGCKTLTWAAA